MENPDVTAQQAAGEGNSATAVSPYPPNLDPVSTRGSVAEGNTADEVTEVTRRCGYEFVAEVGEDGHDTLSVVFDSGSSVLIARSPERNLEYINAVRVADGEKAIEE